MSCGSSPMRAPGSYLQRRAAFDRGPGLVERRKGPEPSQAPFFASRWRTAGSAPSIRTIRAARGLLPSHREHCEFNPRCARLHAHSQLVACNRLPAHALPHTLPHPTAPGSHEDRLHRCAPQSTMLPRRLQRLVARLRALGGACSIWGCSQRRDLGSRPTLRARPPAYKQREGALAAPRAAAAPAAATFSTSARPPPRSYGARC
jgi:hypothetical protein